MFIGHYGAAYAAKALAPRLPLAAYFVAAQALDIGFSLLVLAGVEKLEIVHGFTLTNPYRLLFMPYTHSLLAAALWGLVLALLGGALVFKWPGRWKEALALGLAVFSHYLLDLPVHTPDLPISLAADSPKLGWGLWNQPGLELALELACLLGGWWLYLARRPAPLPPAVRKRNLGFVALLVLVAIVTPYLPDPPGPVAFALEVLASYLLLPLLAGWSVGERWALPSGAGMT
jgi:hypothetical protein